METSCLAAYVPLPEGKALTGEAWYNNDGILAFPALVTNETGGVYVIFEFPANQEQVGLGAGGGPGTG